MQIGSGAESVDGNRIGRVVSRRRRSSGGEEHVPNNPDADSDQTQATKTSGDGNQIVVSRRRSSGGEERVDLFWVLYLVLFMEQIQNLEWNWAVHLYSLSSQIARFRLRLDEISFLLLG
ncbi:hypothetical protein CMV_007915 [Castanea mollissima]|uniref:Uncharacterized protein n=1 Tax=Castanea mollissima TaxID=60419 RepID=A0A8J4VSI9_9ROSI|nr:hypothetical protein CMV_007915 [Castanea mollissima]